ncbi:MAG TPA: YciI family protein [Pseudonocardiaceae bacterium]|nr:YciI family protein [Pseudonocardiaceae bacterium]
MAKYLVLIYGDEQRWEGMSPQERRQIDDGHRAFREHAGAAILASGQLGPTSTATSMRAGVEGPLVTDGPFLETKEVIGGFYLLQAPDLDRVLELVADLAEVTHDHSGVEITPLV